MKWTKYHLWSKDWSSVFFWNRNEFGAWCSISPLNYIPVLSSRGLPWQRKLRYWRWEGFYFGIFILARFTGYIRCFRFKSQKRQFKVLRIYFSKFGLLWGVRARLSKSGQVTSELMTSDVCFLVIIFMLHMYLANEGDIYSVHSVAAITKI